MVELSETELGLLKDPNFAHLATIMPDGSPQVTPIWIDEDGGLILVNTAEGRVKTENLRRDQRVGISVINQENPYVSMSIRGTVVEDTHEGADEHIDSQAKKYLNQDKYPFRQPGEERVLFKIRPESVFTFGT